MSSTETRIQSLLARMTLEEKIGQMNQIHVEGGDDVDAAARRIARGEVGSVINLVDPAAIAQLQSVAHNESRFGIGLLVGRDVIHGFATVAPIGLGQAATWNPEVVRAAARMAAVEAAKIGINWTFAPMIDVTRDPRWGRIAESPGEDTFLASAMATAMVQGFQGDRLDAPDSIAACAKHFAGYGAVEAGRDYATTDVTQRQLRDVYLPPFKAAVDAGAASVMTSFSDIDGIPATANDYLLRQVLRDEWGYDGMVVSDWESVRQLVTHGIAADDKAAALSAVQAGVDMEMVSETYFHHLADLIDSGAVALSLVDAMVANVLRLKLRLGLLDERATRIRAPQGASNARATARKAAYQAAAQGTVLLQNLDGVLPLCADRLTSLAIIGPLADAPHEQMGTWVFDGQREQVVTPRMALKAAFGHAFEQPFEAALSTSRDRSHERFDAAAQMARDSDAVLLVLGEESILSGEAHCRADIGLPGAQLELARHLNATGTPIVAVIMAGRPLTLEPLLEYVDALLFAWHPGSMGGPALVDLMFGHLSPSGRLPVSFPRMVGQIPIFYNHKNGGKPPYPGSAIHIDDIPVAAPQTSFGMTSFHLDAGYEPLFEFGFGLSYAQFTYADLSLDSEQIPVDGMLEVSVAVTNDSDVAAEEVVQLYVRDRLGSVTRPVRELKAFERVALEPGQRREVRFLLAAQSLAFWSRANRMQVEPGEFDLWVGGSSSATLHATFEVD
jgi:beta-glucosidase